MIDIKTHTFTKQNKVWTNKVLEYYEEDLFGALYIVFGVSKEDLLSKTRTAALALCRKVHATVLCLEFNLHPEMVAKHINRDRTSVLYYTKNHDSDYEFWSQYKHSYNIVSQHYNSIMDLQNIMTFYDEKISDRKQIEVIQSRLDELVKENNKLKQEIKTIKTIYNHG